MKSGLVLLMLCSEWLFLVFIPVEQEQAVISVGTDEGCWVVVDKNPSQHRGKLILGCRHLFFSPQNLKLILSLNETFFGC